MFQVNVEREKFSLGEKLRRVAVPVQFAGGNFPRVGQTANRRVNRGETSVFEKPDDGNRSEQRDGKLHEQETAEPCVRERGHAARRQRLPCKFSP